MTQSAATAVSLVITDRENNILVSVNFADSGASLPEVGIDLDNWLEALPEAIEKTLGLSAKAVATIEYIEPDRLVNVLETSDYMFRIYVVNRNLQGEDMNLVWLSAETATRMLGPDYPRELWEGIGVFHD